MSKKILSLPKIKPYFAYPAMQGPLSEHIERNKQILLRLLPLNFFDLSEKEASYWLDQHLPLIQGDPPADPPDLFTIYFLCCPAQEIKADKVVSQMLRRWLLQEKEVQILGLSNMYFYMEGHGSRLFFAAQAQVMVEGHGDLSVMLQNLPAFRTELGLCLSSAQYFNRFLDTKALSLEQKSARVQEYLRRTWNRYPEKLEVGIFEKMGVFCALSPSDFRKFRLPKQLARIIASHYLMEKSLLRRLSVFPRVRHFEFRFLQTKLQYPFGTKAVLGVAVALSLFDRYENFDDQHLTDAIISIFPRASFVKGSYYSFYPAASSFKFLYIEVSHADGRPFSLAELKLLRRELKGAMEKRVERLIPSIFMLRNEEEVMRNLLILSQELKYLSDFPQVMINFEKQEASEIHFTLLIVRVLKKDSVPIEKGLTSVPSSIHFQIDRKQTIGYVRKKAPKEASVFHLRIPKRGSILRVDSSVDIYQARGKVLSMVEEALGQVRDYNGGMILKQGELLSKFKEEFSSESNELIESFFFSLTPIEAQATTDLEILRELFRLLVEFKSNPLSYEEESEYQIKESLGCCFGLIHTKDQEIESFLQQELSFERFSERLIQTKVKLPNSYLVGIVYRSSKPQDYAEFAQTIKNTVIKWKEMAACQQVLRLSFIDLPASLDPRLGGDEYSSTIGKMLFEGLFRVDKEDKPSFAIAQSFEVSEDHRRYTFKLRPSKWSDGTALSAFDFEYAWKKILSPSYYTVFAYFFFSIQGAREAKDGKIPVEDVGVKAIDDHTLVVDLIHPFPEFLEQLAHPLFSPVPRFIDQKDPHWAEGSESLFVCNGPMKLEKNFSNGGYQLVKNPHFWDHEQVYLDRIYISQNNAATAFEMFKNGQIDWIGHPMHPWETYFEKEGNEIFKTTPLGVCWMLFNTQSPPFDNLKLRQALSYAIDREKICQKLPEGLASIPFSPLPPKHARIEYERFKKADRTLARKLFEEALEEMGLTRQTFPILTCYCIKARNRRKQLLEWVLKDWEEVFGITGRVEDFEFSLLFSKLTKGDFQAILIPWKPWVNDPFYTLNAFQYRADSINFTNWEDRNYQMLVEEGKGQVDLEKRLTSIEKAEKVLANSVPVLPIFYEGYPYMHKKKVKGVVCSESGTIDFRWAYIER